MFQSCEGDQWFDIRWHDGFKTITRRVDGTVLRSGRALVRELGSAGIPLFEADARAAERFLAAYLMTNGGPLRSTLVHVARHLGWQDDGTFVACDGGPWPVEPGQSADLEWPAVADDRSPNGDPRNRIVVGGVPRLS